MKKRYLLLCSIILLVSLSSIASTLLTVESRTNSHIKNKLSTNLLEIGTAGKDWTLEDILADSSITFSNFEDQVVLLDFFATWCDPCKTAMVELAELRQSYSAQQLVMISIGTDPAYDSEASLEAFAVTYNMNWKIVIDTIGLSDYYQITSIPTIYIFDKDLNVAYRNVGIVGSTLLEGVVDSLLGDSSSQPTTTRSSGNSVDGFWANNWYWVIILIVFTIIGVSIFVQRRIVIMNNKKKREQELAEKKRKAKIRKLRR